jgi:hypothetical protein
MVVFSANFATGIAAACMALLAASACASQEAATSRAPRDSGRQAEAKPSTPTPHSAQATHWTPASISTDQYEATPTFTPDGREMFFMLSNRKFEGYRVLATRCVDGAWSRPQPAPFAAPEPMNDADPFVTPDGKRVYFISERAHPDRAKGRDDFDIWSADRKPDGSWLEPQRLPDPVNSSEAELLPRMSADGKLYFGSDRAGGLGKMDIYVATLGADRQWQVSNVGPPVSTAASEHEADVSRDGRTLIVVADRGDKSHLYRYENVDGRWIERERIPARPDVFQVGPLLSPSADRLLFAQVQGERSGEMFLIDLRPKPDLSWPPRCSNGRPEER